MKCARSLYLSITAVYSQFFQLSHDFLTFFAVAVLPYLATTVFRLPSVYSALALASSVSSMASAFSIPRLYSSSVFL